MDLLPHNASPLKVYLQTKRILRNTSRAKNPDWYKSAGELNLQWHIWVGSFSVSSGIYNMALNTWFDGPGLPPLSFDRDEYGKPSGLDETSRDAVHDLLRRILATRGFGEKAKSIGIIFHLADSVRARDLAPDFSADLDLEGVNELLIEAPEIAFGDESLDQSEGMWRLLPLPGAAEGARRSLAVQVSSQYRFLVDEIREYGVLRNLPVIVNVHSAPIEVLGVISKIIPDSDHRNGVFLFHYESFTFLFATGPRKELLLVRPLLHRSGQHLSPAEIADVIKNTGALLNIRTPTIAYVSLAGMPVAQINELLSSFREENPGTDVHVIDARQLEFLENISDKRLEFWIASHAPTAADLAPSTTFSELRKSWSMQDFYGPSKAETELMPSRSDLRLLQASRWIQRVAILIVLAFAGWTGADFIAKMRSEAWELDSGIASSMEEKVVALKEERREWDHWSNLLAKRSEGWLALESLLELFPDNAGVILKEAAYRIEASNDVTGVSKKLGLERVWSLSGYANPEVATELPTLGSRTRMAQLLNRIAGENHAEYLSVEEDTRDVEVTLQQRQGAMPTSLEFPAKVARHFRTAFELGITQSLSGEDALAITISTNESE
jgi:hypothetical protein